MDSSHSIEVEARPGEPLSEHIEKCFRVFDQITPYLKEVSGVLQEKSGRILDPLEVAFWTVAFHDYGKSTKDFQGECPKCGRYTLQKNCPICGVEVYRSASLPHPLASFLSALRVTSELPLPEIAGILAIVSHHSPLRPDKYKVYSRKPPLEYLSIAKLDEFVELEFERRYGHKLFGAEMKTLQENPVEILHKLFRSIEKSPKEKLVILRYLYAYIKTILHYCDWRSVKGRIPDYFPPKVTKLVKEFFKQNNWKLSELQEKLSAHLGNALLQAPCGSGKTEAAIFWADNNLKFNKVMYLLPTITTTNKMYERLQQFYGNKNIDILHSYASYLRGEREEEVELERHELKSFMSPVTVATVDQFLLHLFNWKRWDCILGNAMNSLIILDEVHCYEPYTLGLICRAFEELRDFPTSFLVMSATIPKPIAEYLKQNIGDLESFVYPGEEEPRINIEWRNKKLETSIPEIINEAKDDLRVLVIANTVRKSKELYRKLSNKLEEERIVLFHGQFNIRDRMRKEDILSSPPKGFIAITTQTVEVSLDLDFDVLYTELAPPDALVQRMGRVNRKNERPPARVVIHRAGMGSKEVYSIASGKILDRARKTLPLGPLSNHDLHQWIREVYDEGWYRKLLHKGVEESLEELEKLRFEKSKELYSLLSDSLKDISSLTRKSPYPTVDAVPTYHQTEDRDLLNELRESIGGELYKLVKSFSVRAHLSDESLELEDGFWVIDRPYSSDYGLL